METREDLEAEYEGASGSKAREGGAPTPGYVRWLEDWLIRHRDNQWLSLEGKGQPPHGHPAECPSYWDGCNCTTQTLNDLSEAYDRVFAEAKELRRVLEEIRAEMVNAQRCEAEGLAEAGHSFVVGDLARLFAPYMKKITAVIGPWWKEGSKKGEGERA